jgi:hypothetical protein
MIAQRFKDDFVEVGGVSCFRLAMGEGQSIKMINTRQFPIHNHHYVRWLKNYMYQHGLTRKGIKPTYGFRHSLVTLFRDLDVSEEIQHSIPEHNVNSPDRVKASHGYGEKSVEARLRAIEQIPRLDLKRVVLASK